MVFSSLPGYFDPSNWQQQPNYQTGSNGSTHQLPPPPLPPPQTGLQTGPTRPNSMTDRARMANIPIPETALKCPRCESTNTKFCYFNNYSLSQPRHFCKTCRRYWTRGGSLRNVPVGGGYRRNKRTKASNSKSPANSGDCQSTPSVSTSTIPSSSGTADMLGLTSQIPQLRFMGSLGQLANYGAGEIGLNYGGISAQVGPTGEINYPMESNLFGGGIEQWRLQQFPYLGGSDPSPGLYPFQGGDPSGYFGAKMSSSMVSQMAAVKMEDNQESRQFVGLSGNEQWSGSGWVDISGFSSSSTSNPL